LLSYPVRLSETAGGKVRVTFLDVPEAVAEADGKEEALYQAKFALEHSLGNYVLHGRPVPVPSDLPDVPAVTTDKFSAPEAPARAHETPEGAGDAAAAPGGGRY
jgi:predicted RNase H-like HicB family nuclease